MVPKNKSNLSVASKTKTNLPQSDIQQQFQKIISSPEFHVTRQQLDFFKFVISETLAGNSDNIKGYTIATQVFSRNQDFDVSMDPIVSIQANKLRRALERYYLIDGRRDPIIIDIPKGGYVPTFVRQNVTEISADQDILAENPIPENAWPTILILPFENHTGDPELDFLGSGISSEMAIEVSRFENLRVLYPRDGLTDKIKSLYPRFILNGELYKEKRGMKLDIHLVDTKSNVLIWGDTLRAAGGLADMYPFSEQIALNIATKVCGESGIITRAICRETKNKAPENLLTHEAIMRFWEYEQTSNPDTFNRAFTALSHAVKLEPDCCCTLGSLSIMYAAIYNLDIPGFENPFEKAVQYAERAAAINSNNQRVQVVLANSRLMSNDLPGAIHHSYQALEINPHSLFMLESLAWVLTLSGDWEHGPQLINKSITLNPFHRAIAHDALWVNYMRQGKYELAYKESCWRHLSNLFWDPVMKASSLGLAGRLEEGKKWAEKLLELRPDFQEKGRWLIGNYVKFDEIQEKILTGLRMSGLKVNPSHH